MAAATAVIDHMKARSTAWHAGEECNPGTAWCDVPASSEGMRFQRGRLCHSSPAILPTNSSTVRMRICTHVAAGEPGLWLEQTERASCQLDRRSPRTPQWSACNVVQGR